MIRSSHTRSSHKVSHGIVLFAAVAGIAIGGACGTEIVDIGAVPVEQRTIPLSPQARTTLEKQGAACTPGVDVPVLCTWRSDTARCHLNYDADDELISLRCFVGPLQYRCHRDASGYGCQWSDTPDCADRFSAAGDWLELDCREENGSTDTSSISEWSPNTSPLRCVDFLAAGTAWLDTGTSSVTEQHPSQHICYDESGCDLFTGVPCAEGVEACALAKGARDPETGSPYYTECRPARHVPEDRPLFCGRDYNEGFCASQPGTHCEMTEASGVYGPGTLVVPGCYPNQ